MSKFDNENPEDANFVVPPVIIAVSCRESQRFLCDTNELLEQLFGVAPIRCDIELSEIGKGLLRPKAVIDQFRFTIREKLPFRSHPYIRENWEAMTRIVISDKALLTGDGVLVRVITRLFPNALAFAVDMDFQRSIPEQISLPYVV